MATFLSKSPQDIRGGERHAFRCCRETQGILNMVMRLTGASASVTHIYYYRYYNFYFLPIAAAEPVVTVPGPAGRCSAPPAAGNKNLVRTAAARPRGCRCLTQQATTAASL